MKKLQLIAAASIAALLCAPTVYADGAVPPTKHHVAGEKLDSGLGELSKSYTGREYVRTHVSGEKLDSGLGELSPKYTAIEYQHAAIVSQPVRGGIDSGLGDLSPKYTAAEYMHSAVVTQAVRGDIDSGLGEISQAELMKVLVAARI